MLKTDPPRTGQGQGNDDQVLAERVRLLYAQSLPGLAGTAAIAVLLVSAFAGQVQGPLLLGWLTAMLVTAAVRAVLVLAYRRAGEVAEPRVWLRRFTAGAIVTGVLWGLAGTALFPQHSSLHQMLLLLVLAGMAAAAVPFFSSVFAVYAGYVIPILGPLAVDLWLQPDPVYQYIAAMTVLYLLMLLVSARRICAQFKEATTLRFERAALADELTTINTRLSAEAQRRRRAQGELQESYTHLQRIMDSANDAIVVLSPDGRFQRVNPAMARLAGRSLDALTGTASGALFSPRSGAALERALGEALASGESHRTHNLELQRPDGTRRSLNLSLAPVREPGGAVQSLVGIGTDVTERRNVERLKDEFVATVSHELRTPLTSIRGALGLVERMEGDAAAEGVRTLIQIANRNSERLLRLIDDLLDLQALDSVATRLRLEDHAVAELVEQAALMNQTYAHQHGTRIEIRRPLSRAAVRVDRDRTLQALTNLLSNAVRHSPGAAVVELGAERCGAFVRVFVTDQGPGIAPEFRARIFERFAQGDSTRSRGGSGLGLSISKGLVEAMGGRIGFQSEQGEGSTFYIDLPSPPGGALPKGAATGE